MIVDQLIAAASSVNLRTLSLFIAVLFLTVAWLRRHHRPKNLPPGPPAWPIVGNAHALLKGQLHYILDEWAKYYGSVTRIWLGPRLAIVLSDIETVKEALIKQADCFSDRMVQNVQMGELFPCLKLTLMMSLKKH